MREQHRFPEAQTVHCFPFREFFHWSRSFPFSHQFNDFPYSPPAQRLLLLTTNSSSSPPPIQRLQETLSKCTSDSTITKNPTKKGCRGILNGPNRVSWKWVSTGGLEIERLQTLPIIARNAWEGGRTQPVTTLIFSRNITPSDWHTCPEAEGANIHLDTCDAHYYVEIDHHIAKLILMGWVEKLDKVSGLLPNFEPTHSGGLLIGMLCSVGNSLKLYRLMNTHTVERRSSVRI